MPKVSVIIPVYNVEKYLRECLDSVINQTLKDIEIICVNDGSTDSSPEILQDYKQKDSRIKVFQQKNAGAGVARNYGMSHATGDFIFFLDGDDFCDTSLLEITASCAIETDADIVVFNHYRYDNASGKKDLKYGLNRNWLPATSHTFCYKDMPDRIFSMINPTPWNKLYRANFIKSSQLQFLEISTTNDITFAAMSAAMATSIAYINKPLIYYRVNLYNSLTSFKRGKLENVITAVLSLNKQAENLPYYQEIINGVRRFVISNLLFALNNYAGESTGYTYIEYYQKVKMIFNENELFSGMQFEDLQNKKLWEDYCTIKYNKVPTQTLNSKPRIIVSLTSFPERIEMVHQAVETLLNQTLKPDMIILWLAEEQFPGKEQELPKQLIKQIERGLTIKWCNDLKSYKKLIPALKMYPNDLIVTVDDDLLFDPHTVERLYKGYQEYPYYIQCHRITKITYNNNGEIQITPGGKETYPCPTYLHKLCGGAGCLYPPNSLYQDVTNETIFKELAPTSDDVWFWLMGVLNGYKVNVVDNNLPNLNYIPGTQDGSCLWKVNDRGNQLFFVHVNNILEHYPDLKKVFANEQKMIKLYAEQTNMVTDKKFLDRIEPDRKDKPQAEPIIAPNVSKDNLSMQVALIRAEQLEREIRLIRSSYSYKIGRLLTFIPRKMRGGFRCCQEHGFIYTLRRLIYKITMSISILKKRSQKNHSSSNQSADPIDANDKPFQTVRSTVKSDSGPKNVLVNSSLGSHKGEKVPNKVTKNYDYYKNLNDSEYERELKEWFLNSTKSELDLDNPQTFNEKIQWLKLYDNTSIKTKLADKYLVREWVKERIGDKYLVPLLGVWDNFDDINFDDLPNRFVLKANHGCGWNVIVKDKESFKRNEAKTKFGIWMSKNFAFHFGLELHYKNIVPKIIAEEYLENDGGDLYDYKVWCFNGKPEFIMFLAERQTGLKMAFYDTEWNLLPFTYSFPRYEKQVKKPDNLDELLNVSEILSKGFSHVRVDFYRLNDGTLKFGEMTFTSASGTCKWYPEEYNLKLGQMIILPEKIKH